MQLCAIQRSFPFASLDGQDDEVGWGLDLPPFVLAGSMFVVVNVGKADHAARAMRSSR